MAFLRQVEKFPSVYSLYSFDDIYDQTYGVADNELSSLSSDSKTEHVSGFKIEIYKIFAEVQGNKYFLLLLINVCLLNNVLYNKIYSH